MYSLPQYYKHLPFSTGNSDALFVEFIQIFCLPMKLFDDKEKEKESMSSEFSESHPRFPATVLINNNVYEIVDCTVIKYTLLRCRNYIFQPQ